MAHVLRDRLPPGRVGVFNVIGGLGALFRDEVFVAGSELPAFSLITSTHSVVVIYGLIVPDDRES